MPAYSYQERFVPMIEDLSKGHTVRKNRTGRSRHARPCETLYLYTGMRTRRCRKIGEARCSMVQEIVISEDELLLGSFSYQYDVWFTAEFRQSKVQRDKFAWKDGFRPAGSTLDNPAGAWELMLRWFRKTHELPFRGTIIYWEDFKPAKKRISIE